MNVGSVFFDEEFEFHDGESGEKLFIVLGPLAGVSVVVKTTSQRHGRGNTFGCQLGDRFANFFLPPGSCYLKKQTWACLDEYYELKSSQVLQKAFSGVIKPVCTLSDEIMRQIQDCAVASDDISSGQAHIVRACLVQVVASSSVAQP